MATDLENLNTRRSAILTELAALTSTAAGGQPSYSIDGQSVSHKEYKDGLLSELKSLNEMVSALGGPFEIVSEGF